MNVLAACGLVVVGIVVGRLMANRSTGVKTGTFLLLAVLWIVMVGLAFVASGTMIVGVSLITPSLWLQFIAWSALAIPIAIQLSGPRDTKRATVTMSRTFVSFWIALVLTCFYLASLAWDVAPLPLPSWAIMVIASLVYLTPLALVFFFVRVLRTTGSA